MRREEPASDMKTTSRPRYMILRLMGKDTWRGWKRRKTTLSFSNVH